MQCWIYYRSWKYPRKTVGKPSERIKQESMMKKNSNQNEDLNCRHISQL